MIVVLDASTAICWQIKQEQTERALRLRARDRLATFVVPSVYPCEVSQAILKATRRREITEADAFNAIRNLAIEIPSRVEGAPDGQSTLALAHFAFRWSLSMNDAAYVELALRLRAEFWTVDEPCRENAKRAGVNAPDSR